MDRTDQDRAYPFRFDVFAERIADYMVTRHRPWKDEEEMRSIVREAVRLVLTEAADETRRLLALRP